MELKKIKLNKLSDDSLAQRQLQGIKGGDSGTLVCGCACRYADVGGSPSHDNRDANFSYRLFSPGYENDWVVRKYSRK